MSSDSITTYLLSVAIKALIDGDKHRANYYVLEAMKDSYRSLPISFFSTLRAMDEIIEQTRTHKIDSKE